MAAGFGVTYLGFVAPRDLTLAQITVNTTQQPGDVPGITEHVVDDAVHAGDDPTPNELPTAQSGTDELQSQGSISPFAPRALGR